METYSYADCHLILQMSIFHHQFHHQMNIGNFWERTLKNSSMLRALKHRLLDILLMQRAMKQLHLAIIHMLKGEIASLDMTDLSRGVETGLNIHQMLMVHSILIQSTD